MEIALIEKFHLVLFSAKTFQRQSIVRREIFSTTPLISTCVASREDVGVFVVVGARDDTTGASSSGERVSAANTNAGTTPANAYTDIHKPNYPLILRIMFNRRYSL